MTAIPINTYKVSLDHCKLNSVVASNRMNTATIVISSLMLVISAFFLRYLWKLWKDRATLVQYIMLSSNKSCGACV